mmetsp:Transcript_12616/g.37517  ORF Transcript_12616/g.37517 Transcript_12616/m.37517 type:complete len:207 (+) Transcript_12616:253-873(+)
MLISPPSFTFSSMMSSLRSARWSSAADARRVAQYCCQSSRERQSSPMDANRAASSRSAAAASVAKEFSEEVRRVRARKPSAPEAEVASAAGAGSSSRARVSATRYSPRSRAAGSFHAPGLRTEMILRRPIAVQFTRSARGACGSARTAPLSSRVAASTPSMRMRVPIAAQDCRSPPTSAATNSVSSRHMRTLRGSILRSWYSPPGR